MRLDCQLEFKLLGLTQYTPFLFNDFLQTNNRISEFRWTRDDPPRALTHGLTGLFFTLNYLLLTLKNLTENVHGSTLCRRLVARTKC